MERTEEAPYDRESMLMYYAKSLRPIAWGLQDEHRGSMVKLPSPRLPNYVDKLITLFTQVARRKILSTVTVTMLYLFIHFICQGLSHIQSPILLLFQQ